MFFLEEEYKQARNRMLRHQMFKVVERHGIIIEIHRCPCCNQEVTVTYRNASRGGKVQITHPEEHLKECMYALRIENPNPVVGKVVWKTITR